MKNSKRFLIAAILVVLLTVTAVSVWAAPSRQGTVPIVPTQSTVPLTETLNFGTGTVEVIATNSTSGTLTVKIVEDPTKTFGPPTAGWNFMPDQALEISISDSAETTIQICIPQTPDMEKKTMVFNYWDSFKKVWVPIPTVTTPGTPPTICGTSPVVTGQSWYNSVEGIFALLGK